MLCQDCNLCNFNDIKSFITVLNRFLSLIFTRLIVFIIIISCRVTRACYEHSRRSMRITIDPMIACLDFRLEIHACNNPSPVFKRCILSAVAVASTTSQGVCEVR